MSPYVISVLGGMAQDLITVTNRLPLDGETYLASSFDMKPGGKGSNLAVAIHRLTRPNPKNPLRVGAKMIHTGEPDFDVRLVGVIAKDSLGPALLAKLAESGVNVDGVLLLEGEGRHTAIANILVESQTGANRILQYPGVNAYAEPGLYETPESLGGGRVPNFMVAQLELDRDAVEQAIETAGKAGVTVLLNPSPAQYLMPEVYRDVSHLVMNETEAFMLAEDKNEDIKTFSDWPRIANHFHRLGVQNVVITLGSNGAYYSTKQGDLIDDGRVDAMQVREVVDTSGAGDCFIGGYIAHCLMQEATSVWNIRSAVEHGCKAAVWVIQKLGRLEPIPWADEVEREAVVSPDAPSIDIA